MATDLVTNSARAEILRRIRAAKGGVANADEVRAEWAGLERGYRRGATRSREAVLELLEDRLRDYDAHVVRSAHTEARGSKINVIDAVNTDIKISVK